MNIERMTYMRDLLMRDAANPTGARFDLSTWVAPAAGHGDPTSSWQWEIADTGELKTPPTMSCGTVVCALGLAALDPEFNKQGLTFEVQPLPLKKGFAHMMPKCEGRTGFEAGARFFGISYGDARYLFDPDCYDGTPQHAEGERLVAQRIDDMMAGNIDYAYHPNGEQAE